MKKLLILLTLLFITGCGDTEYQSKYYKTSDYTVSVLCDESTGDTMVSISVKVKASSPKQAIKAVINILKELPEAEENGIH